MMMGKYKKSRNHFTPHITHLQKTTLTVRAKGWLVIGALPPVHLDLVLALKPVPLVFEGGVSAGSWLRPTGSEDFPGKHYSDAQWPQEKRAFLLVG